MNKTSPFLLLILGLLVGFPAARLATAPPAKPEPSAKTGPAAQAEPAKIEPAAVADQASLDRQDCKPEAAQAPLHPWCMPVRLLRDFFSLPVAVEKPRGESLKEIVAQAKATQYDLRFLVALVPALPDPRMDQALDAIQRAFANSKNRLPGGFPPAPDNYLLDRAWLPWVSAAPGAVKPAPAAPGILLFRGTGPRSLEVVFLVPETSKMGIQKDTFREALELIAGLQDAAIEPRVAILGPSFSGSVESVRHALLSWRQARSGLLNFRVASGSATADGLEKVFDELDSVGETDKVEKTDEPREKKVSFCRTALPDSVLQAKALRFLKRKMGWKLRQVGLLVEDDTQYGQSFVNPTSTPVGGEALGQKLVLFTFPSHLSDLRTAWEDEQKAEKAAEANALPTPRRVLGLDLSGREQELNLVPTFSSTTTSINDLLLANLLQTIAREGIRYVGIVSTDPMDKLFLAEKLRVLAPDVVLFTFDSNLLYAHPDHAVELDGMLVLGSYPLFTEGAPGFPSPEGRPSGNELRKFIRSERRQFGSEYQEGVYQAARYLLDASSLPAPQAWIAAVGNGSLWPIAQLRVDPQGLKDAGYRFCEPETRSPHGTPKDPPKAGAGSTGNGFDDKDDLQILLLAGLFCLLAAGLHRATLLDEIPGAPIDPDDGRPIHDARGNRALLMAGTGLLAAATGILLAVATVPLWAHRWRETVDVALSTAPFRWIYLLALVAAYGWLVLGAARAAHGDRPGPRRIAVWLVGGLAAFVLLILAVFWLGVPGDQMQLFYLRVRAFSSGLSPLVPLGVVAGAIYFWIWSELKRRRLMVRLASDCPLESLGDPAVKGYEPMMRALRHLLARTWPRRLAAGETPPWLLPAIAFVPPVILLWGTVQPIGEARPFGRLFILLVFAAYALSALSFYRFVRLWWETRHVLHRLDNASPEVAGAFEAISKELDWRPIKSFGWRIPPFRSLMLSVHKLRELAAADKVTIAGGPGALEQALQGMFDGERSEGSVQEIENRNKLERILSQACLDLRPEIDDPEVKKFLALRVAAYLRFVFAHLRSCLIAALTSGLLALIAVTLYAFEPKHLVSLGGWLALALAVVLTLWIFLQMDRNPTLSRIGGTTPGQVNFDTAFVTKIITYAGIPVLGLVATQFPEVGRLLGRVVSQFLRIVGGG
ncbi:MAG: hypothetical protein ACJ76Y_09970 [Thermoanaerobaculia bacterium]